MPQVDLSLSSVCGGGDRKVACETIAGDGDDHPAPEEDPLETTNVPDYAPESFWLSKDAELDWLDQNAFIERKDSGKGSVTSIPNSVTNSQRYSLNLKSKASIIGLPKPQKQNYSDRRSCRPANIRLFPKRPGPVSGRPAAVSEPSSPKVSCMGRVRSRKDRSRRGKNNRKKQNEPGGLVKSRSVKERKPGFWKNFRGMFRSKGPKAGCKGTEPECEPAKRSSRSWERKRGLGSEGGGSIETVLSEPPVLGGVKRFASGRRSDAWAGEVEVDGSQSEPLDRGPIWRRRESGPPAEVSVGRSWEAVGPASV